MKPYATEIVFPDRYSAVVIDSSSYLEIKDKEKYIEFAKELYEHGALEDEDFNLLKDNRNTNDRNKSIIFSKINIR